MRYAVLTILAAAITLPATYAAAAPAAKTPNYAARVKTCNDATKGLYNFETKQTVIGACLSNTNPVGWTPEKRR
jgi:hypothetical protein